MLDYDFENEFEESTDNLIRLMDAELNYHNLFFEGEAPKKDEDKKEDSSDDKKEKKGILTVVGEFVVGIFKKFYEIIKKIIDTVFGKKDEEADLRSDVEIVNDMISRHPEYGDKIIHSINKDWLTYKDVSKYENDIVGLVRQLEQARIDKATFIDKVKMKKDEFMKNDGLVKTVTTVGTAVTAIVGIFRIRNWLKDRHKNASKVTTESVEIFTEAKSPVSDPAVASALRNALSPIIKVVQKVAGNYETFRKKIHEWAQEIKNKLKKKEPQKA